jgi:chemotaxis protein MotB
VAARRKKHVEHEEHENHERWLITYADMITLLMVLFIVLYSISQVDLAKFEKLKSGFNGAEAGAGILEGSENPLEGGNGPLDAIAPQLEKEAAEALHAQQEQQAAFDKEHAQLEKTRDQIVQDLATVGMQDSVNFRFEARGLVVTVVTDRVLFDIGADVLRPEGREVLDHLAGSLGRLPNPVSVEGHTDNTPINGGGRFPTNWELSTARATSVLRYLVEAHHLPAPRLSAAGYADQRPIAENASAEGRTANRRVEIVVLATVADPSAKEA